MHKSIIWFEISKNGLGFFWAMFKLSEIHGQIQGNSFLIFLVLLNHFTKTLPKFLVSLNLNPLKE